MKKYILILIIILINLSLASMTKLYVGNENDQLIVGIESLAANTDAGIGLDLRTYFRKSGILVNGVEYGSVPGKTQYSFLLAGKSNSGVIAKYRKDLVYTMNEEFNEMMASTKSQAEFGYGKGTYLLY